MQKGETRGMEKSESWVQNTFLLRRLGSTPICPSVEVDFSQSNQENQACSLLQKDKATSFLPIYNNDFCYFTPAFALPTDKDKYITNSESYLSLHQQKIEELSIEKTELLVAKPSRSNSFCCICKATFQDYLTHVNMPRHQQLMHSSEFLTSITKLCTLFNKIQVEEPEKKKKSTQKKKIAKVSKAKSRGKKEIGSPLSSTGIHMDFSLSPKANEIMV